MAITSDFHSEDESSILSICTMSLSKEFYEYINLLSLTSVMNQNNEEVDDITLDLMDMLWFKLSDEEIELINDGSWKNFINKTN